MNNYIPKIWDDIIGLEEIENSIKSLYYKDFSNDNISYKPIILYGERGSGKTSIAHIIANDFKTNKENIIDQNCFNYSKVDQVRERLSALNKSSIFGNRKVWILDEVHMLSLNAKEVLL